MLLHGRYHRVPALTAWLAGAALFGCNALTGVDALEIANAAGADASAGAAGHTGVGGAGGDASTEGGSAGQAASGGGTAGGAGASGGSGAAGEAGAGGSGGCEAGFEDCDKKGDGCEVELAVDKNNCGVCGNICQPIHGAPTCQAGKCTYGCQSGFEDCNLSGTDGCEADTRNDAQNCGSCNKSCPHPAGAVNTAGACSLGQCGLMCVNGFLDCEYNLQNGCEINPASSIEHCSACGKVCSAIHTTFVSCNSGKCALNCAPGWSDCDDDPANGCESDTQVDGANCGACGHVCGDQTGCTAGACDAAACAPGFRNCDASTSGCELPCFTGCDGTACAQIQAIAAGDKHSCAILSGGVLACWGDNQFGQLGDGGNTDCAVAKRILPGQVAQVSLGTAFSCALMTNGEVKCWGDNEEHQLGDGGQTPKSSAADVLPILGGARLVRAGKMKSACAILSAGDEVYCWGHGFSATPAPIGAGLTGVSDIWLGTGHVCVLLKNGGGARCWGDNGAGQVGIGSASSPIPPTMPIANSEDWTLMGVGDLHAHGGRSDSMFSWGANSEGQLGVGTEGGNVHAPQPLSFGLVGTYDVRAIDGGYRHSCALVHEKVSGMIEPRCWGRNDSNRSGEVGNTALTGKNRNWPARVLRRGAPFNVKSLAVGWTHNCVVFADKGLDKVACWGEGDDGRLGNGAFVDSAEPQDVIFAY